MKEGALQAKLYWRLRAAGSHNAANDKNPPGGDTIHAPKFSPGALYFPDLSQQRIGVETQFCPPIDIRPRLFVPT